jgi:hypothetical protein
MYIQQFVQRPLSVAGALAQGACGGTYVEACILISGVISGIAAHLWPGEGGDRRRFVEAWVRYADPMLLPHNISLPLLLPSLRQRSPADAAHLESLRPGMFRSGGSARIVTGNDVDVDEASVQAAVPNMTLKEIRSFSYPALFYKHVRSSLTHEYQVGKAASALPMTTRSASVSYSNHGSQSAPGRVKRLIHFSPDWLLDIARSIASNVDAVVAVGTPPVPAIWWIQA